MILPFNVKHNEPLYGKKNALIASRGATWCAQQKGQTISPSWRRRKKRAVVNWPEKENPSHPATGKRAAGELKASRSKISIYDLVFSCIFPVRASTCFRHASTCQVVSQTTHLVLFSAEPRVDGLRNRDVIRSVLRPPLVWDKSETILTCSEHHPGTSHQMCHQHVLHTLRHTHTTQFTKSS